VIQTELASLRRYHGISQEKMANLLNIDVRTYVFKEKGTHQFKLNEMFIISKTLSKPLEEIFLADNFMPREMKGGK